MPPGLINPYITGTAINDRNKFFGRDDLFRFIEDNLVQGTSVILLHGQRRIGKSSLLAQIPNFLSHLSQHVFIPLSLEGQSQGSLEDILHHLATGIVRRLNLSEDQVTIPSRDILKSDPTVFSVDFFIELYEVLGDRKPVLLLDEFDTVGDRSDQATTEEFFRHLQSMITNQPAKFCLIPVVGRRLEDVKILVSLFRQAPRKEVGLLDETHTRQLITKPSEGILEYEPSAIAAIWQLCAGHPYFIQILCSVLFEKARDKKADEVKDWQKITQEDVNKNIDEAIERADNGLAWFRQGLPIAERVVFAAVAEMQERSRPDPWKLLTDNGVVLTEELYEALETLKTGGFIRERELAQLSRDRPYSHEIIVEIVRRWFIRRHSLRTEILELDGLHPEEISPLYQQAKELQEQGDVIEAIVKYQEVLQINPNHFPALLGMASACLEDEQFSQAVELYTRICKVDNLSLRYREAFVKSLLGNGRDFMQKGNFLQAKTQFLTALELEPENRRTRQRLSEVEAQLEQEQQQIRLSLQTLRNPFFVGAPVPPASFVGRQSIIAAAFDQIYNRSHLAIWGNTGIGKSSLLQLLASSQAWQQHGLNIEQAIIVTLNCADIVPFTRDAFWREIFSLLENEIREDEPLHKDIEQMLHSISIVRDNFRLILEKIGEQEKFLLLLLDDYNAALYLNDNYTEDEMQILLSDFRNLGLHSKQENNLSIILTSNKRLNAITSTDNPGKSPWYNHYLNLQLRLFNEQEISELLGRMPCELKLTTELKQVIQEVSGGYPVLLQNACYLVYNFWRSGQNLTIENFTGEFLEATKHIFQDWWLSCDEAEQSLLIFIAISHLQSRLKQRQYELIDIELILSQNERHLTNLEEMGLIKRAAQLETTDYQFTSSMMEFWLLRQIETSDEEKLRRQHEVALKLMSQPQAERIQFIIQRLWHSNDASTSVIDWLSRLAPATGFGMR
ncbi:MAG: AAA family ATPase [Desmonostoc geniculatum HA4340-LM1]|jgi:tetratricopeptide (TPR) repeat protein|nr:AAA family ATPase [Desmonostoc geniculatum HA4340-LM1]